MASQSDKAEEANIENLITQLRDKLEPILVADQFPTKYLSDNFLKRWIRVMNYNLGHSVRAIRKNLKWRHENQVDEILNEDFSDFLSPVQYKVISRDFEGRPVILVEPTEEIFAYSDKELKNLVKNELKTKDRTRLQRLAIFQAETLDNLVKDSVTGNCRIIIDAKGRDVEITRYLKLIRKLLPLAAEVKEVAEEHYPGIVYSVYVINGPKKTLKVLLGVVASTITSAQKEKLKIFGRKKEKWSKALLEIIPVNDLSYDLGGTKDELSARLL